MSVSFSRRTFLSLSALVSAAGILPQGVRAAVKPVFRTLGRTGLKVSEVGMGVMITSDAAVVRAALDAGINYFDTARSYMGGRNEAILGEGLKGRRREAVVATKCHRLGRKKLVISSVETSLKTLRTDYIDILQLHSLRSREEVFSQENLAALEELKKSGKIRFCGVTTHSNMVEVMDAAVEAQAYDTVLSTFNFQTPPELARAIERTAGAGLGVVAMKIMTGGYRMTPMPNLNPYQSALKWVLRHQGVATTIPSLATFEQLKEDAAVMGTDYSWRDDLSLKLFAMAVDGRYCRGCGACEGQCPNGVDVPTALRALMYLEGYRRPELARNALAGVDLPCAGCSSCPVKCRFGIRVGERMETAALLRRTFHV
jgi:hypothetical protein